MSEVFVTVWPDSLNAEGEVRASFRTRAAAKTLVPGLDSEGVLHDLFPGREATDGEEDLRIQLPPDVADLLLSYMQNGDDCFGEEPDLWASVYLSVVTITTLGYGDVKPLTTCARLLVASEAILGIVLAGLFLAALAQSITNQRTQSDSLTARPHRAFGRSLARGVDVMPRSRRSRR